MALRVQFLWKLASGLSKEVQGLKAHHLLPWLLCLNLTTTQLLKGDSGKLKFEAYFEVLSSLWIVSEN